INVMTNAHHRVPNTSNNINVRGVLKDTSSSIYRGLIKIEKNAQQTNSYLSEHSLMIGKNALANSIPSLEIDANDVKASHGSTTGKIDEEQIFYLMSRGLSRRESERLIIEGFFIPIIEKIPLQEVRERIAAAVTRKMDA
ncbi:MAG: SufD family Fe-S cluster assembly protein, partial [Candidatus Aenigmarchaeota archaeon]|nr:SufD family Fe-S cluster assembly protein [Candidatus Aenigmarchaeota archaeon]